MARNINGSSEDQPESITMDVDDLNGRILLQVFPEAGDIDIHAPGGEIIVISPDFEKSLFSRQDTVFGSTEKPQQIRLFGRERHCCTRRAQLPDAVIIGEHPDLHLIRYAVTLLVSLLVPLKDRGDLA